jgi:hypothetical protein
MVTKELGYVMLSRLRRSIPVGRRGDTCTGAVQVCFAEPLTRAW